MRERDEGERKDEMKSVEEFKVKVKVSFIVKNSTCCPSRNIEISFPAVLQCDIYTSNKKQKGPR